MMNMNKIPVVELSDSYNTGRWGVADMKEEAKATLQRLLDSGEMFDTGMLYSSKECDHAEIIFDGYNIRIEAGVAVDSMEDFAYIADCATDGLDLLTSRELDDLIDTLFDEGYEECVDDPPRCLPKGSTVDDILTVISDMTCSAYATADVMFDKHKKIVNEYINWVKKGRPEHV